MVPGTSTTDGRDPYSTTTCCDDGTVVFLTPTVLYIEAPTFDYEEEFAHEALLWRRFFLEIYLVKLFVFIAWWEERTRHFLRVLFNIFLAVMFRRTPPSKSGFLGRAGKAKKGK